MFEFTDDTLMGQFSPAQMQSLTRTRDRDDQSLDLTKGVKLK